MRVTVKNGWITLEGEVEWHGACDWHGQQAIASLR